MTPEEQAVIDAAIDFSVNGEAFQHERLDETVHALLAAREEVDAGLRRLAGGGHVEIIETGGRAYALTPGDTLTVAGVQFTRQLDPWAAAGEPAEDPAEFVWHPRTWRDVRTGDTVRMPGTDITADIAGAALLSWHVDPRSNTYRPTPLEHEVMRVVFVGQEAEHKDMNPDADVEIHLTRAEITICNQLHEGWESRS